MIVMLDPVTFDFEEGGLLVNHFSDGTHCTPASLFERGSHHADGIRHSLLFRWVVRPPMFYFNADVGRTVADELLDNFIEDEHAPPPLFLVNGGGLSLRSLRHRSR